MNGSPSNHVFGGVSENVIRPPANAGLEGTQNQFRQSLVWGTGDGGRGMIGMRLLCDWHAIGMRLVCDCYAIRMRIA
jgi:hypothetical protein